MSRLCLRVILEISEAVCDSLLTQRVGTWKQTWFIHWCLQCRVEGMDGIAYLFYYINKSIFLCDIFHLSDGIFANSYLMPFWVCLISILLLLPRRVLSTACFFSSDRFSDLLKHFWTVMLFSNIFAALLSFTTPALLLSVFSILLLPSLMKNLNRMEAVPVY